MSDFSPIEKPWGKTRTILEMAQYSLHFARAEAGGYCSIHLHRSKWNRFYVREGELLVWQLIEGHWRCRILRPGQVLDVPPGVRHRFLSRVGCRFWEVYWPAESGLRVDPDDIVRFDVGGRHDAERLLNRESFSCGI